MCFLTSKGVLLLTKSTPFIKPKDHYKSQLTDYQYVATLRNLGVFSAEGELLGNVRQNEARFFEI